MKYVPLLAGVNKQGCGWLLTLLLTLTACSQPATTVPQLTIQPGPLVHHVKAEGELFAVNSISINAPVSDGGPRFIASLAPDYSQVKPGDVVVRFEARQLLRSKREATQELAGVDADLTAKQQQQQADQTKLQLDQQLVRQEFGFADQFNIDDIQIRSRLEILDSLQNKEFLQEKQHYLGWQEQSFDERIRGELDLLQLKTNQQQSLIDQADSGLNSLEIKSPHRGMLLFDTNWRGEKPTLGQMVFSGEKIGSIPDLSLQQLKLFIIEQEAVGIQPGQKVSFALATEPSRQLSGKVVAVSGSAQSRERRDPRKFIEVTVAPDTQQADFIPGNKVTARILISEKSSVLAVPLQAIFNNQQHTFVWKADGDDFIPQPITLGSKSLTHAEVLTGLAASDRIALLDVAASNTSNQPTRTKAR